MYSKNKSEHVVNYLKMYHAKKMCLVGRGKNNYYRAAFPSKTQDIDPILFLCWADVEYSGPTSKKHWGNVSCLLN